MGKISIVSRRRRDKRFPETEAQRRARVRELHPTDIHSALQGDHYEALTGEDDFVHYSEALLDGLAISALPKETAVLEEADTRTDRMPVLQEATVRLDLSPEQSQAIAALSLLAQTQPGPLALDLQEWHSQRRTVLQFSLHSDTVPAMLSLKELCHQLKVGRRSVMRLIREGKLRYYRIGTRYRFAAAEVKQYLQQSSAQEP